jgi:hypothetical protein
MARKLKGVKLTPQELRLIEEACNRLNLTFSEFARAAMVSYALLVVGSSAKSALKPLVEVFKQIGATLLGVAGVRFEGDKVRLLLHIPGPLADLAVKLIKAREVIVHEEVKSCEQEAGTEAAAG